MPKSPMAFTTNSRSSVAASSLAADASECEDAVRELLEASLKDDVDESVGTALGASI